MCIVGVVTLTGDDSSRQQPPILDVLGGRYRLPPPSSGCRARAFLRAFESEGVNLGEEDDASLQLGGDDAREGLPRIAAAASHARGASFRSAARRLRKIVEEGMADDGVAAGSNDAAPSTTAGVLVASIAEVRAAVLSLESGAPSGVEVRFEAGGGDDADRGDGWGGGATTFASSAVGGCDEARAALEDALALDPGARRRLAAFGLSPPTGLLLYGPPGCGKTLLARSTAEALRGGIVGGGGIGGAFLSLGAGDVARGEVGMGEKIVVGAFEAARADPPSVVFVDEFEALFSERGGQGSGRLASTLLQCMDDVARWRDADLMAASRGGGRDADSSAGGVGDVESGGGGGRVVVLGATNAPWMVDRAFLRPGRFDRSVHVGLPDASDRHSILRVHVRRMRLGDGASVEDICAQMASACEGFSGADLQALCRAAVVRCLQDHDLYVTEKHFRLARELDVQPSSDDSLVRKLRNWRA